MTQAIIENLEALLVAVEAHPEAMFNLNNFRKDTPCGTLFCVAGLACTMPRFQELGLQWNAGMYEPEYKGTTMWYGGGDELFGPNSMSELFQYKGGGALDKDLGLTSEEDDWAKVWNMTDKELAIARLKHRIAEYKENN